MRKTTWLGNIYMTRRINEEIANNYKFAEEIRFCFERYKNKDWGELCQEDKQMNDDAIKTGNERILAAYDTSKGKIYIITEHDYSATTILFADEY